MSNCGKKCGKKCKKLDFEAKIGNLLGDMTDNAKEQVIEDVKKAMKKEIKSTVKKKMKQRRKRFVKRVVILGAVCAGGYYLYKKNEKVKSTVDSAVENASKFAQDKVVQIPVLNKIPFDKLYCCKKA